MLNDRYRGKTTWAEAPRRTTNTTEPWWQPLVAARVGRFGGCCYNGGTPQKWLVHQASTMLILVKLVNNGLLMKHVS